MADGYRSLLAPWIGGAANNGAQQIGYRGLLAFWAGGAANAGTTPTPTPADYGMPQRRQARIEQDDEEVLAALAVFLSTIA